MNSKSLLCLLLLPLFMACSKDEENPTTVVETPLLEVSTILSDSLSVLEMGDYQLTADAKRGGRVSSFKYKGQEILSTQDYSGNYGSTFWVSPQSLWNWPPPAGFDQNEYVSSSTNNALIYTGEDEVKLNVGFVKQYAFDNVEEELVLTYTMTNAGSAALDMAPWEITRVPVGGIVFYPKGELINDNGYTVEDTLNCIWLDYDNANIQSNGKVLGDAEEGWLAYAYDGMVLLKTFENINTSTESPANEAEIEIYVSKDQYIEVEQQGKLETYAPLESRDWEVRWQVIEIPNEVSSTKITAELRDLVLENL